MHRRAALALLLPGVMACASRELKSPPKVPAEPTPQSHPPKNSPIEPVAKVHSPARPTTLSINTTDIDSAIEIGLRALEKNVDEAEGNAPYFEVYGHPFESTRAWTGQHVDPERTEPPSRHHNWTLGSNVAGKSLYAMALACKALGKDASQSDKIRGLSQYVTAMMYRPRRKRTVAKDRWIAVGLPGDRASAESKEFSLYYLSTAGSGYRGMLALNLLAKDVNEVDPQYLRSTRELMDVSIHNLLKFYVHGADGAVVHDWERYRQVFALQGGRSTTLIEPTWVDAFPHSVPPLLLDALIEFAEYFPGGRAGELIQDLKEYTIEHMYPAGYENMRPHGHMYEVVSGISSFARLAVREGDRALLERMRAYFDALFTIGAALPSGWVAERLYGVQRQLGKPDERLFSDTGEINCSVQMVEAAIRFGDQGFGAKYYEYAERALRAHVLPSQLRDVDQLVASPDGTAAKQREYAEQIRGAFGFPAPYGVIPMRNAYFVTAYFMDISAGAVASLARIRERAHQVGAGSLYIPLLLDLKTAFAAVSTPYAGKGGLTIAPKQPFKKILVRRPPWLAKAEVRMLSGGAKASGGPRFVVTGDWIEVTTNGSREPFTLNFPLAMNSTKESINERTLSIEWRGDSIATMSGIDAPLRFFPSKS